MENKQKLVWSSNDEAVTNALAEIAKYQVKMGNDTTLFRNSIGASYEYEEYDQYSLKRVTVKDAKFQDCKFIRCAVLGSNFTRSVFADCLVVDSSFQFSNLTGTTFVQDSNNNKICIMGDNFSNTNFINAN